MKDKVKIKDFTFFLTEDSLYELHVLSYYFDKDESDLVNCMIHDYYRAMTESIHQRLLLDNEP